VPVPYCLDDCRFGYSHYGEIKEEIKRYLESGNEKNTDWKRSKTLTADDMILYT